MNTAKLGFWTHWSRLMHICISDLPIIDSDNGLLPRRCQAIISTSAGILLIGTLGTNFKEVLIQIHAFLFRKMHLKMLSAKWHLFDLTLNVLMKLTHGTVLKYTLSRSEYLMHELYFLPSSWCSKIYCKFWVCTTSDAYTVETLYSTIYYS